MTITIPTNKSEDLKLPLQFRPAAIEVEPLVIYGGLIIY
jgi:hypothetical protein